jgi:hypothetical protein
MPSTRTTDRVLALASVCVVARFFCFGFGVMRLQVDVDVVVVVVVVVDSLHWSRFRSLQQTKNRVLQRKLVID